MRLRVQVLGVTVLEVSTDQDTADTADQGAPDYTSMAMGPVGFSNWDRPTIPALEVES